MSDLTGNSDDQDQTLDQVESFDETIVGTDTPQDTYPYDGPLTDPDVIAQLNERGDEVGELVEADDAATTLDGELVGAEDGSDSPEEAALHVVGGDARTERDVPPGDHVPPQ